MSDLGQVPYLPVVIHIGESGLERKRSMIPTVVHYDYQPVSEVFGFVMTELNGNYIAGTATVTVPGSGRFGTVRVTTSDGIDWHAVPHTFATGYAGLRDAMRHMYQRSGVDNASPTIPMAAIHTEHHAYAQ